MLYEPPLRQLHYTRPQPRKYQCVICGNVVLHPHDLVLAREVVIDRNNAPCVCTEVCYQEYVAKYYRKPHEV